MQYNKRTHNITFEGARACKVSPEEELNRSVMSCLLWEKEFYEEGESIADRILRLASEVSSTAVARLATKARTEYKLRHVPLLLCLGLLKNTSVKGPGWNTADVIADTIQRPDELMELLSLYWKDGKKPLPKQLKLGLAKAFDKFDEYQFAKYNRDRDIKLRDVMFMAHPKPSTPLKEALFKRIADNTLETPDTWEVGLSTGGDKKETFERLLCDNKLGYLALLRNLRNMDQANVDARFILSALDDTKRASRVLPFRFIAASKACPKYETHLDLAMLKVMEHMPKLMGKTRMLVDVSGSMTWPLSDKSDLTRMDAACGLAILLRGICEDIEIFSFSNNLVRVPGRSGMALRDAIVYSQPHGGTALGRAVNSVNDQSYDRLVVITDEQTRDSMPTPTGKGYIINVASYQNGVGYGQWTHIHGFSEACVKFIQELEKV
ncbi:MAG: TROVE domain-containing protein [Gammaproteobacteria bacterium]|nr:TROVE domain-containing protein [Gammaproteobacteria bacterium]